MLVNWNCYRFQNVLVIFGRSVYILVTIGCVKKNIYVKCSGLDRESVKRKGAEMNAQ